MKTFLALTLIGMACTSVQAMPTTALKTAGAISTQKPIVRALGMSMKNETQILKNARAAFKAGQFQKALAGYSRIPTSSDRWPMAREEMAWTSFRMKEYQMASAQVRSLTNDYLKTQIDLEPYLLQAIVNLYSCDYNAVFTTLEDTKKQMGEYVSGMESMSTGTLNETQLSAIEHLISNKTFAGMKPEAFHVLPRRFYLDKRASFAIKTAQRSELISRLRMMAKADNERNHKILQHLHLVEIEAIQRAFIPNDFGGKKLTVIPDDSDRMVFNGDKELWADEVDKTQADLYMCESKTGKTL